MKKKWRAREHFFYVVILECAAELFLERARNVWGRRRRGMKSVAPPTYKYVELRDTFSLVVIVVVAAAYHSANKECDGI